MLLRLHRIFLEIIMANINHTGMKRAALINDYSCFGKCSLSVAIPIISAYGAEAVALPTAILSTHTGGLGNYVVRDMTEEMRSFSAHWKELDMKFDCIYTGFCCSPRQIEAACDFIGDFGSDGALILVDPVLGDNGAIYPCFSDEHVAAMRELCRYAHVITPNRTEAALLAGMSAEAPASVLCAALQKELGIRNVVITGVRDGGKIGYHANFDGIEVAVMKENADVHLHGTGDVFASAFCGELMSGKTMETALKSAADFCDRCVRATLERLPSHWYGLAFEDVLGEGKGAPCPK